LTEILRAVQALKAAFKAQKMRVPSKGTAIIRQLSPELVALIQERAGNVSAADLAREMGVSTRTIYTVVRGSASATG
jgi:HTH domain